MHMGLDRVVVVGASLAGLRAAEELRVTHGAVSRHVQMLEGWLGVPLFERHNRRVVLTEAGQSYAAEIGAALDRVALATARQVERGRPRSCPCRRSVLVRQLLQVERWALPAQDHRERAGLVRALAEHRKCLL